MIIRMPNMVRLMAETVALQLAMCLNRALCEQVDRAEQPQQRSGYNCAHEGSRPDIIREFASPSGGSALRSGLFSADYCAWGPPRHLKRAGFGSLCELPKKRRPTEVSARPIGSMMACRLFKHERDMTAPHAKCFEP